MKTEHSRRMNWFVYGNHQSSNMVTDKYLRPNSFGKQHKLAGANQFVVISMLAVFILLSHYNPPPPATCSYVSNESQPNMQHRSHNMYQYRWYDSSQVNFLDEADIIKLKTYTDDLLRQIRGPSWLNQLIDNYANERNLSQLFQLGLDELARLVDSESNHVNSESKTPTLYPNDLSNGRLDKSWIYPTDQRFLKMPQRIKRNSDLSESEPLEVNTSNASSVASSSPLIIGSLIPESSMITSTKTEPISEATHMELKEQDEEQHSTSIPANHKADSRDELHLANSSTTPRPKATPRTSRRPKTKKHRQNGPVGRGSTQGLEAEEGVIENPIIFTTPAGQMTEPMRSESEPDSWIAHQDEQVNDSQTIMDRVSSSPKLTTKHRKVQLRKRTGHAADLIAAPVLSNPSMQVPPPQENPLKNNQKDNSYNSIDVVSEVDEGPDTTRSNSGEQSVSDSLILDHSSRKSQRPFSSIDSISDPQDVQNIKQFMKFLENNGSLVKQLRKPSQQQEQTVDFNQQYRFNPNIPNQMHQQQSSVPVNGQASLINLSNQLPEHSIEELKPVMVDSMVRTNAPYAVDDNSMLLNRDSPQHQLNQQPLRHIDPSQVRLMNGFSSPIVDLSNHQVHKVSDLSSSLKFSSPSQQAWSNPNSKFSHRGGLAPSSAMIFAPVSTSLKQRYNQQSEGLDLQNEDPIISQQQTQFNSSLYSKRISNLEENRGPLNNLYLYSPLYQNLKESSTVKLALPNSAKLKASESRHHSNTASTASVNPNPFYNPKIIPLNPGVSLRDELEPSTRPHSYVLDVLKKASPLNSASSNVPFFVNQHKPVVRRTSPIIMANGLTGAHALDALRFQQNLATSDFLPMASHTSALPYLSAAAKYSRSLQNHQAHRPMTSYQNRIGRIEGTGGGPNLDDPGTQASIATTSTSDPMWSDAQNHEDEYQSSPQTIQITAVPNGLGGIANGWNGWNGINGLNGLNGFNALNSWGGPWNGRQVLLVNKQPQVGSEWRSWVIPVAIVLALPLILGALFVPVFLKSVMFLIQILQMLGLLMPPSQLASHILSNHNQSSG